MRGELINVLTVVSELNFGGGENRIFHLARAIDPGRFRHTVATIFAPDPDVAQRCGSMRAQFEAAGIRVHELGLPHPRTKRAPKPLKLAHTARMLATATARILGLIRSSRADVVDAHLETALYTALPAAASAGVPSLITLYSPVGVWRFLDGQSYRRHVFPPIRRFNLRLARGIVTDSQAGAEELRGFLGAGAPPVHVVPNGVRLDPPTKTRVEVLRTFGIPEDTRATILAQIAGLVPYKGQNVLLQAARKVISAGHDVYVLCVGDERHGPDFAEGLRRQAEAYGIADRVRIQRYAGNIADVWSVVDVHVHAALVDSLPNAIIEGMSLAKPAVLSAVGGIPDHVEDGRTGLLVRPNDAAALSDALLRLLRRPEWATELGHAAHARYLERFTPEVTSRQLEACFETTVDAQRGRGASSRPRLAETWT